jgi:hypothetical protein
MITKFRIGAAGVALISALGMATSANAATASANANANILAPLTIAKTADLDFGTIAVNGAGTVIIGATAAPTRTCVAPLVCSGTHNAAAFNVTGQTGSSVSVGFNSVTTLTGPGDPMVLSNMSNSAPASVMTLAAGPNALYVGGELAVAATQAAGAYVGTFNVVVLYQ